MLLQEGIGDTIRISLTPEPGGDRTREVIVAQEILQTMGLRAFAPMVIACPGCGRTTSTMFQELAQDIQSYVRDRMTDWRKDYPGFENLQLAVMGCIVNGPGESKHADIGISLARHRRTPGSADLHRRQEGDDAAGREHLRPVQGDRRGLCEGPLGASWPMRLDHRSVRGDELARQSRPCHAHRSLANGAAVR